jgi:predicted hotdog family 3-hydroxylacyl-ACP dehydratase
MHETTRKSKISTLKWHRFAQAFLAFAQLMVLAAPAIAQRGRGEIQIEVRDPQGQSAAAVGELVSESNQVRKDFAIPADGKYLAAELAFGVYRLTVTAQGFAPWTGLVEIRSEVPVRVAVILGVAPVNMKIEVTDAATLLDPSENGTIYSMGGESLREHVAAQDGRDLSDAANDQPGWLYEANGVLHPRGSEYQVQYVLDGMPLTQNRSPAFAPPFDSGDVESMRVMTAGFPAEYGRKLGGVIELTTEKNPPEGWHGRFEAGAGSFESLNGAAEIGYTAGKNHMEFSGRGFHTDRYLDPPVLQNYTNWGNGNGFSAAYEHDFSDRNRLRFTITRSDTRYSVPNELVQQATGQRQDVDNSEVNGQIYYQHISSENLLWSFSGSVRDSSFVLRSNDLATPILVSQDRGYREGYVRADVAGHAGHHDWKAGVDSLFTPVHEALSYQITDPSQFDPGTASRFAFAEHKWDIEPAFYVQDNFHQGNWNVSAGLRFDHYGFVVSESAVSPRVAISRYIGRWKMLLHVSYDRVFQTPATENLLLASSAQVISLNPEVLRLPVRLSRGNYFEGGISQALFARLRLDANVFRRTFRNFADDDVLLDTGVSFPIAFNKARIFGEELRLAIAEWHRFSGFLSYSNQSAIAQGPTTGGLFVGSEAGDALTDTTKFAVTQDQRNTVRASVRAQIAKRLWTAASANYGSGLPVELDLTSIDTNFLLAQYGPEILSRVNFDRGRVRPNFSLNAAAGVELYRKESRILTMQIAADNLTDRVNVLNFAGLFSGTAVAAPRRAGAHLRFVF